MRVTLATHGGMAAGINLRLPPRVVDAGTLDRPSAEELARFVAAATAAETSREPAVTRPGRVCDELSYTITVESGGHSVVLSESDTTMSPEFGALLSWLEERG